MPSLIPKYPQYLKKCPQARLARLAGFLMSGILVRNVSIRQAKYHIGRHEQLNIKHEGAKYSSWVD